MGTAGARTRCCKPVVAIVAALAGVSAAPATAAAQAATSPAPDVRWARDGIITGAALAGVGLAGLIPVDSGALWKTQLLPIDDRLEGRLSQQAAGTSDTLAAVDVVTPLALLVAQGGGINEASGRRALLYTETIAASLVLNGITKYLVGRPRPYVYSRDARVQAYADGQGKDSRLSFYSGHASTTFAAAVAGSFLYAQAAGDARSRAVVWGFELALAGATADLRTRAGKHFYSDVLVGALVGGAVGYLVPRLHGGPAYHPTAGEWAVIAAAPVAGVAIGELLPARPTRMEPLASLAIPWVAPGGGGVLFARAF
jgi:membrane-associated phospholipid phosphatase